MNVKFYKNIKLMKKIFKDLFMVLPVILMVVGSMFTACQPDEIVPDEESRNKVKTTFTIGGTSAETKSLLEDGIDNKVTTAKVGIYTGGKLVAQKVAKGLKVEFELDGRNSYNAYATVNIPGFDFPASESSLPAKSYAITQYPSSINTNGMPMSGSLETFKPSKNNFEIHVKRLFTKIIIGFDTNEAVTNIHVASCDFLNASSSVYPFDATKVNTSSHTHVDMPSGGQDFKKTSSLTLYVPESIGGSQKIKMKIVSHFTYDGVNVEKTGNFSLGTHGDAERNNYLSANYFTDLFDISEGGVVIEPWNLSDLYIAQKQAVSFEVSGVGEYSVSVKKDGAVINASSADYPLSNIVKTTKSNGNTHFSMNVSGIKPGVYTLAVMKKDVETDNLSFNILIPQMKFNASKYILENTARSKNFTLGIYDKANKLMSKSDFDNTLYGQLIAPAISVANSCNATVAANSTSISLKKDINNDTKGVFSNALIATAKSGSISKAYATVELKYENPGGIIIDPWNPDGIYTAQAITAPMTVEGNNLVSPEVKVLNADGSVATGAKAYIVSQSPAGANTKLECKVEGYKAGTYKLAIIAGDKRGESKLIVTNPTLFLNSQEYTMDNNTQQATYSVTYRTSDRQMISFDKTLYDKYLKDYVVELSPEAAAKVEMPSPGVLSLKPMTDIIPIRNAELYNGGLRVKAPAGTGIATATSNIRLSEGKRIPLKVGMSIECYGSSNANIEAMISEVDAAVRKAGKFTVQTPTKLNVASNHVKRSGNKFIAEPILTDLAEPGKPVGFFTPEHVLDVYAKTETYGMTLCMHDYVEIYDGTVFVSALTPSGSVDAGGFFDYSGCFSSILLSNLAVDKNGIPDYFVTKEYDVNGNLSAYVINFDFVYYKGDVAPAPYTGPILDYIKLVPVRVVPGPDGVDEVYFNFELHFRRAKWNPFDFVFTYEINGYPEELFEHFGSSSTDTVVYTHAIPVPVKSTDDILSAFKGISLDITYQKETRTYTTFDVTMSDR